MNKSVATMVIYGGRVRAPAVQSLKFATESIVVYERAQLENDDKYRINVFWPSFTISYLFIRLFADFLKLRFYVKKTHIHHFTFGLALMPFSWIIFSKNDDKLAWAISGVIAALIASEVKELILDEWAP